MAFTFQNMSYITFLHIKILYDLLNFRKIERREYPTFVKISLLFWQTTTRRMNRGHLLFLLLLTVCRGDMREPDYDDYYDYNSDIQVKLVLFILSKIWIMLNTLYFLSYWNFKGCVCNIFLVFSCEGNSSKLWSLCVIIHIKQQHIKTNLSQL